MSKQRVIKQSLELKGWPEEEAGEAAAEVLRIAREAEKRGADFNDALADAMNVVSNNAPDSKYIGRVEQSCLAAVEDLQERGVLEIPHGKPFVLGSVPVEKSPTGEGLAVLFCQYEDLDCNIQKEVRICVRSGKLEDMEQVEDLHVAFFCLRALVRGASRAVLEGEHWTASRQTPTREFAFNAGFLQ